MKCLLDASESLFYNILHWESMILEGGGLQVSNIGGGQRKLEEKRTGMKSRGGSLAVGS